MPPGGKTRCQEIPKLGQVGSRMPAGLVQLSTHTCPALELHVAVPHAGHLDASSRDDLLSERTSALKGMALKHPIYLLLSLLMFPSSLQAVTRASLNKGVTTRTTCSKGKAQREPKVIDHSCMASLAWEAALR